MPGILQPGEDHVKSLAALVLLIFLFACGSTAKAQEIPALELYGGYDFVRFDINSNVEGQPPSQTYNGNGGGGQVVYNVDRWLGILADVGGYWATNSYAAGAAVPYLFGPRVNFRLGKVTPFTQALVGGVATSSGIVTAGWQNHFATTAGAGLDVRISRHISIRPVQAEYLMTRIPDGLNNRQDNFRFSTGISLLLGAR